MHQTSKFKTQRRKKERTQDTTVDLLHVANKQQHTNKNTVQRHRITQQKSASIFKTKQS